MQVQKNAEEDWRKQEGIMEMETYIFMYIHLFIKIFHPCVSIVLLLILICTFITFSCMEHFVDLGVR